MKTKIPESREEILIALAPRMAEALRDLKVARLNYLEPWAFYDAVEEVCIKAEQLLSELK